jgi:hypothetical protein
LPHAASCDAAAILDIKGRRSPSREGASLSTYSVLTLELAEHAP